LTLDNAVPAAGRKTATARGQKFPPPNLLHFCPLALVEPMFVRGSKNFIPLLI